jgi:predicted HicB family RNase H-like nuclease
MSDTDNRVDMEIDIPDDVLFKLMLQAHEHDITLNQMVERILREQLDQEQNDDCRD